MKPEDAATIAAAQAAARQRPQSADEAQAAFEQRATDEIRRVEAERGQALARIVDAGKPR